MNIHKFIQYINKNKFRLTVSPLFLINVYLIGVIVTYPTLDKVREKYSYINPSFSYIDKKDLIVNFQALRDYLVNKYEDAGSDYTVSLYMEFLNTGANISINKDIKMWPASLVKVPVAMAALKKVENEKWKITNELVILDEDKDSQFGKLYLEPSGTPLTIDRLLHETLVNSDNTAHFVLLRNLDANEIEDLYNHMGLGALIEEVSNRNGNFDDNKLTTKNYSLFFRSLYNSTYLNPENSQYFLNILTDTKQEYMQFPDVKFAHKTGVRDDLHVIADSGIVYTKGRPFIITVMVQKQNLEVPDQVIIDIFRDISENVYSYVKTYE